jgi:hypothetical protein
MREITVGTMANEPGKSKVANSGCPGLCLLRGVTDLEGYLKLHMLLGEQNAKPGVVPTCVGPPEGGRTYTYRRLPCAAEKRHPRTSLVRRAQTFLLRLVRGSSVKIAVASAVHEAYAQKSGVVMPQWHRRFNRR